MVDKKQDEIADGGKRRLKVKTSDMADAAHLIECAYIFYTQPNTAEPVRTQSDPTYFQRTAVMLQLSASIRMLTAMGMEQHHMGPLIHLRNALDDAQRGIRNPLLSPVNVASNRPLSNTVEGCVRVGIGMAIRARQEGLGEIYDVAVDAVLKDAEGLGIVDPKTKTPLSKKTAERWAKQMKLKPRQSDDPPYHDLMHKDLDRSLSMAMHAYAHSSGVSFGAI